MRGCVSASTQTKPRQTRLLLRSQLVQIQPRFTGGSGQILSLRMNTVFLYQAIERHLAGLLGNGWLLLK